MPMPAFPTTVRQFAGALCSDSRNACATARR
jgi:hypothetical protein